jgi:hypothetical protein
MPNLFVKILCAGIVLAPLAAYAPGADAQAYPPPYAPGQAVPPPPPGPQAAYMVWQPGRWRWNGNRYVWINGHYARAPRAHAVWVDGHWVARHGRWVWVPGHWA